MTSYNDNEKKEQKNKIKFTLTFKGFHSVTRMDKKN